MSRKNDGLSTRIVKDYTIDAAVHFENEFMISPFEMQIYMDVETDSVREQNVAIERMNYFLNYHIDSAIFVDSQLAETIAKYEAAGITVLELPEEPYDQIVGTILMLKCNAIMEERLIITDCVFGSKLSSGIKFDLALEQVQENFTGKYWWNNHTVSTAMTTTSKKKDKIVKLFDADKWTELNLTWREKGAQKT